MAAQTINSKFITFATKEQFNDSDKFTIPSNSIVFISDTGEIYCNSKRYVGLVNSSEFGMVPKCNETDTLLGSTDYILTYNKTPQWKKSTNIVRTTGDQTISGTKTFTSDLYLDGDRIFTHYTDDKNKEQRREVLAFTDDCIELGKGYQTFKPLWLNGSKICMNIGSSGKFSIDSSGHVGIGTHTPSAAYMLQVAGGGMVADKVVSWVSGFVKNGCDNNSVLLAGGGHKSLNDFKIANVPTHYSLVAETDPYSLIKETAMSFEKNKLIHASLTCSYLNDTSFISMLGWMSSRTTDLNGWFLSNSDGNNFQLYGVHDNVWTNDTLLHSGNSYVSGGSSSITVTLGPTSATLTIPSKLPADGGKADSLNLFKENLKPNGIYAEKQLIYCQLNSTNPGKAGYAGDTTGFPVANNANGILWTGVHSGHYGGQLGISSNGYLYYRFITNKNFPTTEEGGSWNRIAWVSEIPTKLPATKLDTSIKIYGNTFDATTDIKEYLYGIKSICGSTDTTSSLLSVNGTIAYDLGQGYYNYQSWIWGKEFKFVGKKGSDNDYVFMMIGNNGNVGIGDVGGAPAEKLHVAGGNVIANGYKKYPENTYTTPYAILADGTARAITSEVTSGSSSLITSGAVYSQINDIKREWIAKSGKTYIGWVTIAKWTVSQAGHFSPYPFLLSIYRNYNSPRSESYTFGFTFGWDTATITQISGNNIPGDQLIEQIRVAKCSDGVTYKLQIYINQNYTTYENSCYCVVHGYYEFTATTVCELSSNISSILAQTKVVANNSYALPQVNNSVTTHGYYEIKVLNNNIASTKSWCILLLHPDTISNEGNSLATGYSVNGVITLYRTSGACLSSLKILSCAGYSSSWNQAVLEVDGLYAYNNFKLVTCTYQNKTYRAICFKASQDIQLSQFRGFIRSDDANFGKIIVTTASTNPYTTNGNGVTNIADYSGLQTKDILANDVRINGLSVSKVGHTHDNYLPLAGGALTGDLALKTTSGDSPALVFHRGGLTTDASIDWKIYVQGGLLKFANANINVSSGSWQEILSFGTGSSDTNKIITSAYGINPSVNNSLSLGSSTLKWANIYATTFTGTATTANKLSVDAGSATQPVYFSNGVPVACGNLWRKGKYTVDLETPIVENNVTKTFDSTKFYPVIFASSQDETDCEIYSPSGNSSLAYNQNFIHFLLKRAGWTDSPLQFKILSYGVYSTTEITIGAIGGGTTSGDQCVWLRGGRKYTVYCNKKPTFYYDGYTSNTTNTNDREIYTVGTNYHGGTNTRVTIVWSALQTSQQVVTREETYDAKLDRTKNYVLAAPNGSNGPASFRALTIADLPHDHSYLPLSGGKMDSTAFISWNTGSDGNDVSDWNITDNGLKIISSVSTDSKAPTRYSTALHVKGRYGFQIAGEGGEATNFWIRNIDSRVNSWHTIIHSSNYTNYTVSKTGTGATGTWDISITGNAATVSTIQTATTTTVGGIKVKSVNANAVSTNANGTNYYGVNIDKNGVGYVALPSFGGGSGDITSIIAGTGLNGGATSGAATIHLSIATSSEIGGIIVSTTLTDSITLVSTSESAADRYYGVQIDKDAKAFVSIPWTDSRVTQTVTTSSNTSWRPFLVGMSYNDSEPFAPTTVTNSVYATHKLKMQPSTGDILTYGGVTLYSSSGDSPHLVFRRGTTKDAVYDWDQYVTGGIFKLRYNKNGTWNDVLSLDLDNNDYLLKDSIILTTDNTSVSGGGSSWGSSMSVTIGGATATLTIPSNPNVDTKNTAGSTDTSSKIYLIGATSQAANPQTYSHNTAYVGTDGCLYSNSQKVLTSAVTSITIVADSGIEVYNGNGTSTTSAITSSGTRRLKLCVANDTDLGGIKIGYQLNKASREYPVVLDSSYAAYVNVPLFTKSGSTACPGLVPSPGTTAGTSKYLREDGSWVTPPNTNTWTANALNVAGYVAAPTSSTAEYVWKTDSNGNPSWQIDYSRGLRCKDTRSTVIKTTDLSAGATFQLDFKSSTVSGLSAAYSGVISFRPYSSGSDWTGGPAHQLAFDVNGIHHRTGDGNGWGSWKKLINSSTIMGGATSSKSGTSGLVPAPPANAQTKFLRGDGSWATVSSQSSTFTGDAETVGGYKIIVTDTLPQLVGASEIVFII